MTITLPPLPYPTGALEPHISRSTIEHHYGQHHAAYVARTNELLAKSKSADRSLLEIMRASHISGENALFNVAAQAWNHEFYWNSMHPDSGGLPSGAIAALIDKDFGNYQSFASELRMSAMGQFGSGWVWVVLNGARLDIVRSANADNPIVYGLVPLLTIDVWEHAYYLDYQHQRARYLTDVIEHLLNWDFANSNIKAADNPTVARSAGRNTTRDQRSTAMAG
ncbi:MAG TPA: superoxide dismutase [Woeseiaceae bacterium]|nr:superoxide dismutase [Woeseiaceae bacterium]